MRAFHDGRGGSGRNQPPMVVGGHRAAGYIKHFQLLTSGTPDAILEMKPLMRCRGEGRKL
jgi:hypothetical protein